uniref:RING-type domain-containing protein n=1 Tax=Meloidogyne incognita TaxID=6306 RepID=A0A914M7Z4_MELIC
MCSVCLEKLKIDEEVKQLIPCNHIFHEGCIFEWIKTKNFKEIKKIEEHVVPIVNIF